MPILRAEGLVKSYGRRRVVDGVSLSVAAGEIVGLLGPNGAGKTTSFKMISGLVKPDQGAVFLQGVDVTRWPLHERSRSGGMGYLPQQASVFAKLSTEDNLKGMMQLLGFSRRQQKARCEELLEQFKITKIRKSKAGSISGGERRRLEIARCLVSNPKIIMLDEPFAGIDPVTVQSVQVVIQGLAEAGIAVLITDHAAREILQITHRTYVVSEGRILCSGTADEIVAHPEVKKKYLGEIEMPTVKTSPGSTPVDDGLIHDATNQTSRSRPKNPNDAPSITVRKNPKKPAPKSPPSPRTSVIQAVREERESKQDTAGVRLGKSQSGAPNLANPEVRLAVNPTSNVKTADRSAVLSAKLEESNGDESDPDILSMVSAVNQAIKKSETRQDKPSDRPKIVFSKPRRRSRPIKTNDLD
ncbi:MAG: lipopolysaccharide export system ATP-binding protein [Mariniblastus sp.]|jgi:lipopolysaccharide export system ATP-binding protein